MRIGIGFDIHQLVPGRPLYLGGVQIPFERGALGHSDGDVVLHAVCDALLGAAGLGDIGEHFPDDDPRHAGRRSEDFVRDVLGKVRERGLRPGNVDVNIFLERPYLRVFKSQIRERLARLVGLPEGLVNVKARTMEGLGAIGQGEAVAAQVAATLVDA
jgi:2-C-methyl-D-erythritol 2,4-cyclodiphosphate synthase